MLIGSSPSRFLLLAGFSWLLLTCVFTIVTATVPQQVNSSAEINTKVPVATLVPLEQAQPDQDRERIETSQNSTGTNSIVAHGDVWVFAATMLLVVATLLLWNTTRRHVAHTRELVDKVGSILAMDRLARLAVSLVNDGDGRPQVRLQNIGRIPVMIATLFLDHLDQDGTWNRIAEIEDVRDIWMLPNETLPVRQGILSAIWDEGTPNAVRLECTFFDIYHSDDDVDTKKTSRTIWVCDHKKRTIVYQPQRD